MRKIVMMLISGAALCAVGVINPGVLSAAEVVEENLADESTAAQTGKQSDRERWDRGEGRRDHREDDGDRREDVRGHREDRRDRREDYRDRSEDRRDRREDFRDRRGDSDHGLE